MDGPGKRLDTMVSEMDKSQAPTGLGSESFRKPLKGQTTPQS